MASREGVNIEDIVLFLFHIGDQRVRAWFGIAENLAVDVLPGMSFIGQCIRGIFPQKTKSSLAIPSKW